MSVQWWETLGAVVGVVVAMIVAAVGATWWSAKTSRAAADDLYDRLKENDFRHIEDRIGRVEDRVTDRMVREVARLEKRLDRVETRLSTRMDEGFRELKALIQGAQAR